MTDSLPPTPPERPEPIRHAYLQALRAAGLGVGWTDDGTAGTLRVPTR